MDQSTKLSNFSFTASTIDLNTSDSLEVKLEALHNDLIAIVEGVKLKENAVLSASKSFNEQMSSTVKTHEKEKSIVESKLKSLKDECLKEILREKETWEAEKVKVATTCNLETSIKLDVGGTKFTTSLTTLRRFPDTMLGAMFSGRHALTLDAEGYYFIDRDGTNFRYILNFLRSPETFECLLEGGMLVELQSEAFYYGMYNLMFPYPKVAGPAIHLPASGFQVFQDSDGVWRAQSVGALMICRVCVSAVLKGTLLKDFQLKTTVRSFQLAEAQPRMKGKCPTCGEEESA
jgi:hypothetical protein